MKSIYSVLFMLSVLLISCTEHAESDITPNQFKGSDTRRIQAAVDKASLTTGKVVIPDFNSNGSGIWLLDSAILLPKNITVILNNCTLQLSDQCRDNMFRSNNVGIGITEPVWSENICIIGIGDVYLKGATNPRATGDGSRTLVSSPQKGRVSYGSDAGNKKVKQKGDWRNIMILMGYVNGFKLKNINIINAHAWAVSFERTINAEISGVNIHCPKMQMIDGKERFVANRDGIDLRHGCKNFHIENISGVTGDDFIALSTLGIYAKNTEGGTLNSTMVTTKRWRGKEDDTEQIFINGITCKSSTRAIAIRANDIASINNVNINGLMSEGGYNALLIGGKGYGKNSQPGKINNIHAMNIISRDRSSMIQIEEPISDCSFLNGIYKGIGNKLFIYNIDKSKTTNIISHNLIKVRK